jgi:hypothetical protein
MAEQRDIAAMEWRAKSDGHVSHREFRVIRAAQHEAAKHIYAQMHDGQVNVWRKWAGRHR